MVEREGLRILHPSEPPYGSAEFLGEPEGREAFLRTLKQMDANGFRGGYFSIDTSDVSGWVEQAMLVSHRGARGRGPALRPPGAGGTSQAVRGNSGGGPGEPARAKAKAVCPTHIAGCGPQFFVHRDPLPPEQTNRIAVGAQ